MNWTEAIEVELARAEAEGLRRRLRVHAGAAGALMQIEGRGVVQFASNNYLGLASHPRVLEAAASALRRCGAGAGASRLLGGSQELHRELEGALAEAKGMPAALVFATGSMANLGLLPALAGEGDLLILDKACHATLYDGARLSGAELRRFPHQDLERLGDLLYQAAGSGRRRVVAVDAVYSMEGDIAPLPALLELCERHAALLVVDEAHSTGVLGRSGRGILEHFGMQSHPLLVLSGTLSKALGSLGGFVAGPQALVDLLVQRSRSFVYATALAPACAAAALEALAVLAAEPQHLQRLRENRSLLAEGLRSQGWDLGGSQTPIVPLLLGTPQAAVEAQERLWEAGYYAPAIRPPTVPAAACRLRLSVSAEHSPQQLRGLLAALGPRP